MLHEVKDGKDVIYKGEIYRCVNGQVDLPERIETEEIKPIKENDIRRTKNTIKDWRWL